MAGITREERARRAEQALASAKESTEIPATTTGELKLNPTGVTLQSSEPTGLSFTATTEPTESEPPVTEPTVTEPTDSTDSESTSDTDSTEEPSVESEIEAEISPEVVTRPLTQDEIRRIQMAQCPIDKLHRNG